MLLSVIFSLTIILNLRTHKIMLITKNNFKIRSAAIILMAAGYGWAGGHYIPASSPAVAYIFQVVVICFLLLFGIKYLSNPQGAQSKRNWSSIALTIFSALSLLANIFNIIHGINNQTSYGSHNSFADLVPIVIIITGTSLWLLSIKIKTKSFNNIL